MLPFSLLFSLMLSSCFYILVFLSLTFHSRKKMVLFGAGSLKRLGFPEKTKLDNLIYKLDKSSKRKLAFRQIVFSHNTSTIAADL